MTQISPMSQDKFNSLRLYLYEAFVACEKRYREALEQGDAQLATQLWAARGAIVDQGIQIHAAEQQFLNSTMPEMDTLKKLNTAITNANTGLAELQALTTALQGAARIVRLFGRLATLFA